MSILLYRAWDKTRGCYVEDDFIAIQPNGAIYNTYNGDDIPNDELEIELCTGLRDVNGKLIYVNDIVKLTSMSCTCTVVYQDGCFWLDYDAPLHDTHHRFEIIGNAHEENR